MKALALLLLCPALALGACRGSPDDRWRAPDKIEHFGLGFVTSVVVGTQTRSPWVGFVSGVGVNALKEAIDSRSSGSVCSLKDFAAGSLGAGFGAAGAYYFVRLKPGGVQINAVWELK